MITKTGIIVHFMFWTFLEQKKEHEEPVWGLGKFSAKWALDHGNGPLSSGTT